MKPLFFLLICLMPTLARGANIMASSASRDAVQAAVNAAADGDTVLIPNGSATWTSGIKTSKQIIIRAQNYTSTPAGTEGTEGQYFPGTMTRNVTITNNIASPGAVFEFQTGNSHHVGVGGIRFNETASGGASNSGPHIRVTGSGSKVPLIFDCSFQVAHRTGNSFDDDALAFSCQGGVIWNSVFSGQGFNNDPGNGPGSGQGTMVIKNVPRDWDTASTMGRLDTNGDVNLYIEDSTFFICGNTPDIDVGGRFVGRHCVWDGSSGLTHGFSSGAKGGRHAEFYDNEFRNTVGPSHALAIGGVGRNHGRNFWLRAGTAVFTENFVSNTNTGFGSPNQMQATHEGGGTYPVIRQVGYGYNGTSHVSDPVYIWNQTGGSAYAWNTNTPSYFQLNRDIFVNSGAKPGYSKYTYPHPLRSIIGGDGGGDGGGGGGGPSPSPTPTPTPTPGQAPSPSPTPTGITATPSSVNWTVVQGQLPPPAVITVTTSNGSRWSTSDTSPYYNASVEAWSGGGNSLPSGQSTTLTPRTSVVSLPPGTYSAPLTISASGLQSVVVPVTLTITTVAPTPTPTSTPLGMAFEAEQGSISAPFSVSNGSVSQAISTGVSAGGRAVYVFSVPSAGNYVLTASVNAPTVGENSFYLNIDGEPIDPTMIWDIPVTSGFENRIVSWRGSGTPESDEFNPKVFALSAGQHTLTVVGREPRVQIDRIQILNATSQPPSPPTGLRIE